MRLSTFSRALVLALSLGIGSTTASAAVIFSDNFDDGDVSDWTKTTNFLDGDTVVTVRSDSFVSAPYAMLVYLIPRTGSGTDLFVRASKAFTTVVSGSHHIELNASSGSCNGCIISFDVLVDGNLLERAQFTAGFSSRSLNVDLSAGDHTLTLGMHTTAAFSGTFPASFDNVRISDGRLIPEPGALALLGLGFAGLMATRRRKL